METYNIHDAKFHTLNQGKIRSVVLDEIKNEEKISPEEQTEVDIEHLEKTVKSLSCSYCQVKFDDVSQQREHCKLDWHRYNLRLSLINKQPITENEFNDKCNEGTQSSISASSESEPEDTPEAFTTAQGKIFLQNSFGVVFSLYACILYDKKDELQNFNFSVTLDRCRSQKWAMLLLGGGHFAGAVFDGDTPVVHKTFHCYTVRAGQGGSQSSRDNKSGGSHPKSAGASLRRYNEQALIQHTRAIIEAWQNELAQCSLIIYRASGPYNQSVLFGGARPLLKKSDPRLRTIPFSTRRATFKEVKRIFGLLTSVQVFSSLEQAADYLERCTRPKQKTLRKQIEESTTEEVCTEFTDIVALQASSESVSSEDEVELFCENEVVHFNELQEFEATVPPSRRKVHRPKKTKKSKAKKAQEREEYNKNEFIQAITSGDVEKLEELLRCALLVEQNQQGSLAINYTLDDAGNTLLHVAAAKEQVKVIGFLLSKDADPCLRNKLQQTPYTCTQSKEVRDVFKQFARDQPDKHNYNKAQIPTNIPTPEEQAERKKVQRKIKRERDNIKKKENDIKRKEDIEKERFLQLSDREKRAFAATCRMSNASGIAILRCFQCAADITRKVPFEYLGNKFCSVECVKTHRLGRPPVLS